MATNTTHSVRSARRCIARSAVSKFLFVTAVAIATCTALALSGVLNAGPALAHATGPAAPQAAGVSGKSYGYPVKPFDRVHFVRANLGDPRMQFHGPPTEDTLMHGSGQFLFHEGVDISAHPGTAVYPVLDGTVTEITWERVRVDSNNGRAFEYFHIHALVRMGQHVTARQTVLGRVMRPSNHVHLTEYDGGRFVNPLTPGRLTPYYDSTTPTVRGIILRQPGSAREVLPNFVRGRVEIVADAEDEPNLAGRLWHGPVTPALVTWQIRNAAGRVIMRRTAADFRRSIPSDAAFWRIYARGTYQNQNVFGRHYSYQQRGTYLFELASGFNTRSLRDGVYDLTVKATDIRGNSGSQTLRFTVHNRPGWS
jgi:hypothetical protein